MEAVSRVLRARNAADARPSLAHIRVVGKLLQHRNAPVIFASLSRTPRAV